MLRKEREERRERELITEDLEAHHHDHHIAEEDAETRKRRLDIRAYPRIRERKRARPKRLSGARLL